MRKLRQAISLRASHRNQALQDAQIVIAQGLWAAKFNVPAVAKRVTHIEFGFFAVAVFDASEQTRC
ncbi:hypothetical protein D3C78_1709960 [compost metagenome]